MSEPTVKYRLLATGILSAENALVWAGHVEMTCKCISMIMNRDMKHKEEGRFEEALINRVFP
jgi:hypothetical protein